jgi:hypothetical protein
MRPDERLPSKRIKERRRLTDTEGMPCPFEEHVRFHAQKAKTTGGDAIQTSLGLAVGLCVCRMKFVRGVGCANENREVSVSRKRRE